MTQHNGTAPRRAVRYAIAGAGGFGSCRRTRLRESGAFEIVGVLDPSDRAFSSAEKEEGKSLRRYHSMEELAADPEVEAAVISTPAHLHIPQAWVAARSGKAIFTEKPLGHDLDACRALVEYCEINNIPHGHGFSVPFFPIWQEVRRRLAAGDIGRVVSVAASTMHSGGLTFAGNNWRFSREHNPGGPLFQCGIHKIDLLRRLFGEGRWIAGAVRRDLSNTPTDDAWTLLGMFGEVPVTLHNHYVASYQHAMEIYGTQGNLYVSEYPIELKIRRRRGLNEAEPIENITDTIPASDSEYEALRDFASAVRERRQPIANGREGLTALELIFEALRTEESTSAIEASV